MHPRRGFMCVGSLPPPTDLPSHPQRSPTRGWGLRESPGGTGVWVTAALVPQERWGLQLRGAHSQTPPLPHGGKAQAGRGASFLDPHPGDIPAQGASCPCTAGMGSPFPPLPHNRKDSFHSSPRSSPEPQHPLTCLHTWRGALGATLSASSGNSGRWGGQDPTCRGSMVRLSPGVPHFPLSGPIAPAELPPRCPRLQGRAMRGVRQPRVPGPEAPVAALLRG